MVRIATYVFVDLETTGIPREENNKTKITELSMVAVKTRHLLDTLPGKSPRVQNKLTLCFNPRRVIQPGCTTTTGLCNDLLEHETAFNNDAFTIINTFLQVLVKPVCLIAQNGLRFDYPIIKKHLEMLKVSFQEDLLCADSYHAFYDIEEEIRKTRETNETFETEIDGNTTVVINEDIKSMQLKNETTPKQSTFNEPATPSKNTRKARTDMKSKRRLFPWAHDDKPKVSYKLGKVYERWLNREAVNAHHAEVDCILMMECVAAKSKEFVAWVEQNHCLFSEIKAMTLGVPVGD